MFDTTFLYTLNCPLTGEVRYLGKSNNPFKRLIVHTSTAGNTKSHKNSWILSLREQGLKPTMDLLDEVPVTEWQFWEREYIRVFRAIGIKLINGTDGGEGNLGGHASEATRRKMSETHKARHSVTPMSQATKKSISKALSGKSRPRELCERLSLAHKGKSWTTAQRLSRTSTNQLNQNDLYAPAVN